MRNHFRRDQKKNPVQQRREDTQDREIEGDPYFKYFTK